MNNALALSVTRRMQLPAPALYAAWTTGWSTWFAEPDSVQMSPHVGAPFHFHVVQRFDDGRATQRHPHYGRFLELVPNERVALTWVTVGTGGVETTLSVRLTPDADSDTTTVVLTHDGFPTDAARDRHAQAWPILLEQMERTLLALAPTAPTSTTRRLPQNRSIPEATFIPVRSYPDLDAAVAWLREVLGCQERLRIPGHRVQLTLGNGAVVAVAWDASSVPASGGRPPATLMVRVADIDATYARAIASGAVGLSVPTDYPYGERQAQVLDPAGHAWTLTQTIADVDPATWGGELIG